jgi:hypothetical protein
MQSHWPPFKREQDAKDHASMIKSVTDVRPVYCGFMPAPLPVQEPVAWRWTNGKGWLLYGEMPHDKFESTPLYTTPPKRKWVGLTDDEVNAAWGTVAWNSSKGLTELRYEYARNIETKLKEKNT